MPRIIVFDVNETLLDLRALEPHFQRAFGDASVMRQWFGQVLRSALVATIIGRYQDFGAIGAEALAMTAARQNVDLSDADRTAILGGMRTLPPHPEVPASLARLREAGFHLITLTNSPPHVVEAQIANAGLSGYFEKLLSVHDVRKFKPAPETYQFAARTLGVETSDLRLVAAHDWDIAGALAAGCAGAFIARPGMVMGPSAVQPDIVGNDLAEVVEQIIEIET